MNLSNRQSATELFRFATLRKPNLIQRELKSIGFVMHTDHEGSYFLTELNRLDMSEAAIDALPQIAKKFDAIERLADVQAIHPQLYDFAHELMANRSQMSRGKLEEAGRGVTALSPVHRAKVWDNLYYDIVSKASAPIRHACINLLIADHFVTLATSESHIRLLRKRIDQKELSEDQVKSSYLHRLAHAAVVVHHIFYARDEQDGLDNHVGGKDLMPEGLQNDHKLFLSADRVAEIERVTTELEHLNMDYSKAQTESIRQAEVETTRKVEKERDQYYEKHGLKAKSPKELKKIDTDALPPLELPQLTVRKVDPLSDEFIKERLTGSARDIVERERKLGADLEGIRGDFGKKLSDARKDYFSITKPLKKRVKVGGKVFGINTHKANQFVLGFAEDVESGKKAVRLCLSLALPGPGIFIKKFSCAIRFEGRDEWMSDDYSEQNRSKHTVFLKLFEKKTVDISNPLQFRFRGAMALSDGQELKLDLEGSTSLEFNWAEAQAKVGVLEAETFAFDFEQKDVYGVNRIGVADYRLVEQDVCCYVPGEVSHIENILAREYKERHTRSLTSTETTTEYESQYEMENQTDTSTTERNEFSTEISAVLEEERSNDVGVSTGVTGTYMGVEMSADTGLDFASSNSSSDSNTLAKNYAVEVTKAATERILQKTTEKRISKVLQEYEENNRHGFDNRAGSDHVTGIYRWVDKIVTNRLVNYGKRLVYEFIIPEPSKFYRQAIEIKVEQEESSTDVLVLEEPVHPKDFAPHFIDTASKIDRDNYQEIAAAYGASVSAPQKESDNLTESYSSSNLDKKEFSNTLMPPIAVPQDYIAEKTTGSLTYDWEAKPPINDGGAFINITFAGETYMSGKKEGQRSQVTIPSQFYNILTGEMEDIPGLDFDHGDMSGTLSGSVNGNKLYSYSISLNVELKLKDEVYEQWQIDTYEAIIDAYDLGKAEYDAATQQQDASSEPESYKLDIAASLYRQVEQTELKRLAIEMLMQPFGLQQGRDFTGTGPCGVPEVVQNPALETYSSQVKFFEQAFDWSIMSYLFYPYYWAKKCDWVELFQSQESTDEVFSAFLQSGMARMTVPVRRGFEKAVTYYMATGEIWLGGDLVLGTDDDLYLSIAEEMEVIDGHVEEEWQITLPTTLAIVQKDSALLDEGGLPCCEDVALDEDGNTIKVSTSVLEAPAS